jgi:hypothetical protein
MEKLYPSDREICLLSTEKDSLSSMNKDFLFKLNLLFDKNGIFLPRELSESASTNEPKYLELARSDYKELRYLGLSGLLSLEKEIYDPFLWEAFYDSFYPIRGIMVDNFQKKDRPRLFNELFRKLTGDPRQVIREKAYIRIKKDFSDLFSFRINNFPPDEQYRLIMFLESSTSRDLEILKDFINGENDDLAARALYRLYRDKGASTELCNGKSRHFGLLRYDTFPSLNQITPSHFIKIFELIDEHAPPGLTFSYFSELMSRPYREKLGEQYIKMFTLIGNMKGPRTRQLMKISRKNQDLKTNAGKSMALAYTRNNQYYTYDLLQKEISEAPEGDYKTALLTAEESLNIPSTSR